MISNPFVSQVLYQYIYECFSLPLTETQKEPKKCRSKACRFRVFWCSGTASLALSMRSLTLNLEYKQSRVPSDILVEHI